MGSYSPSP